MNWDDLRFFLVLSRKRTLSAAARELKVSQPTVGRRITALERSFGTKLFERAFDGFTLSPAGVGVLQLAERMEQDAVAAELRLSCRQARFRTKVRITASEWLVSRVLSRLTGPLIALYPGLALELFADARHLSLARREADVALRPRRFEQDSVVQRATAKVGFGVYAARSYLSERGMPRSGDGSGHVLIAMSDDTGDVARTWLEQVLPRAKPTVRTNGRDAMTTLAEAGVGLACLARVVGDAAPDLQRVSLLPAAPAPILWLGVHREARDTPAVRAVTTYLAEQLRALEPQLCPA